jgi:hypothetical protein
MTAAGPSGTGRRRPLLSAIFRASPSRLALTSVGLAAAAIVGVQLGRSAISEINPVHFQGPLAPQAITPPPEPAPFDPYGQSYVWAMDPGRAFADCMPDCSGGQMPRAMRLALDESAGRDPSLPIWRDATPATELQPWPPGALPNGRTFERYMHYPVDREQAEHSLAEPAAAPAVTATPAEALRPPPSAPVASAPPAPAAAEAPVEK